MTFDQLIDRDRLKELLETGTGESVRVGILDSGVASDLPELNGRVKASYEVIETKAGSPEIVALAKGHDVIEHGTACAYTIHQLAPQAELFSLRVIDASFYSTSERLLAALEFATEQGWDILNLSLGTQISYEKISRLADEAHYRGRIWIAARDNKREKVGYPAALTSVVGVDMDYFKDPLEFRFDPKALTEVEANGVYVRSPTPTREWKEFTGSSFAAPYVTGIAARLRQHLPEMNSFQFKAALSCLRSDPKGAEKNGE